MSPGARGGTIQGIGFEGAHRRLLPRLWRGPARAGRPPRRSLDAAVATRPVSQRLVVPAALAAVATVSAIVAEGEFGPFEPALSVNLGLAVAPGIVWLGAGLIGWIVRPASRVGPLVTAVGFAYFATSVLAVPGESVPFTLGLLTLLCRWPLRATCTSSSRRA
jgi:hypothetical protein